MFIVHQEYKDKPGMKLQMHERGMHYFDPRDEYLTFIKNVS